MYQETRWANPNALINKKSETLSIVESNTAPKIDVLLKARATKPSKISKKLPKKQRSAKKRCPVKIAIKKRIEGSSDKIVNAFGWTSLKYGTIHI